MGPYTYGDNGGTAKTYSLASLEMAENATSDLFISRNAGCVLRSGVVI